MGRLRSSSKLSHSPFSMPYSTIPLLIILLCMVSQGTGQKPSNNNERSDINREPFLVKVTTRETKTPEKRGTIRLTTVPGQNTFPYRYVYPVGQPAYTQFAAYTTPRSASGSSISSAASYPSTSTPPLKVAYTLPTTMLLVMAHPHHQPHAAHSPAATTLGGTFMLIPATAAGHPAYNYNNYNVIPQSRIPTVAYIPAQYLTKPNYANYVASQQLLYKAPTPSSSVSHNYNHAPNHNYNQNSSEENDSSESSTPNYGNRVRNSDQYKRG